MDSIYNHEQIIQNRDLFLAGKLVNTEEIRPEILSSWIRSSNKNIDPTLKKLPSPTPPDLSIIDEKWMYRRDIAKEPLKSFFEILERTSTAIYALDNNFTIYFQKGNKSFLERLNSINLGLGATLDESIIGTTAVALVSLNRTEAWVIGGEHYLGCFHDLASSSLMTFDDAGKATGYLLLITSREDFNPYQLFLLSFSCRLNSTTIELNLKNTELFMTHQLLNLYIEQRDQGVMYINTHGFILTANQWFHGIGLDPQKIQGEKYTALFPELKETEDCLLKGKGISMHEVCLSNVPLNNKYFYVDCQPIKKEDSLIGMIVTFYHQKKVFKSTTKLFNLYAHYDFSDLIGMSPEFLAVKTLARNTANSPSNVLIIGESGTGKELFAQAIHNSSNRSNGPFVSINCAALPKELIGSELFGYIEGAFTGARKGGAPGKFELANKGTIFLDEIGEMPIDMQTILLRVIEERQVTRLGGSNAITIDVKIIAATNKDLWKSVESKEFRLDLYYRLDVIKLIIPPLRERKDDIPLLSAHLLKQLNLSLNKNISGISADVLGIFMKYSWPGNIRELRNIIERGINQCTSDHITINDLSQEIIKLFIPSESTTNLEDDYNETLVKEFSRKMDEIKLIKHLMEKYHGNKTLVANELGVTRMTLYKKLKKMHIE